MTEVNGTKIWRWAVGVLLAAMATVSWFLYQDLLIQVRFAKNDVEQLKIDVGVIKEHLHFNKAPQPP